MTSPTYHVLTEQPSVILCWWLQETLTRWHLPHSVWKPLEGDLLTAHNKFEGLPTTTDAQQEAIQRLFALCFGKDGDQQEAPFTPYLAGGVGGDDPHVGRRVAYFILTGSDPC